MRRKLRVAFFSTGDELASVGTALKEGEVYDSNRYTLHGMLARLGVEIQDLGVVRDDPALLEAAFRKAAAAPTRSSPPAASRWAKPISSSR